MQGSAGAYLVARLRAARPGPILVISPSSQRAERFAGDLRAFGAGEVPIFPRYDTPPYDRFSPHPEVEARRMSLLYRLLSTEPDTPLTLVAPWSALLRRVLPRQELRERVTHLERGMTVDRDALLEVLVQAGYHHSSLVEERGEVAARGGILDLFPPQLEQPVRLEFDFEEIGSIRAFDPATQRSDHELQHVVAIPPRSCRLPSDLDELVGRARSMGRKLGIPESNIYEVTEALARRGLPPGVESLEALFHDTLETVFDYLAEETLVVIDDPEAGRARARAYVEEVFEAASRARNSDRFVCDPLALFTTDDSAWEQLRQRKPLVIDPLGVGDASAQEDTLELRALDHTELQREIKERQGSGRALEPLVRRLDAWREAGRRVRLSCTSLSSAERLVDILGDYGHPLEVRERGANGANGVLPGPGEIDVFVSPLAAGFELPLEDLVIVTEQDIFGARIRRRVVRAARPGESIERLAQIQDGDYLVHPEHGIGQFGGLQVLKVGGIVQEFLLVFYGKGDKLYLPVSRLAQIQRYTGADEKTPRLDRLGGQTWVKTKARERRAIRDMAEELLAVIAAREVLEGHAYPPLDADYEEFEARFPYEDTPDQARATEELHADLSRARPMDRLVCGDVGFGTRPSRSVAESTTAAAARR